VGPRRKPSLWKVCLSLTVAVLWLAKTALDWGGGDRRLLVVDLLAVLMFAVLAFVELWQRRRADIEV
jgi:hypothetical protein